jgi:hypothetical protein
MILHACAMFLEIGIVGVTLAYLLSELRDDVSHGAPQDRHRREIVMTSTSLSLTIIACGITLLGSGDTVSGLKVAGTRISAAGHALVSRISVAPSYVNPTGTHQENLNSLLSSDISESSSQVSRPNVVGLESRRAIQPCMEGDVTDDFTQVPRPN